MVTYYKITYSAGSLGHLPDHDLFEILQEKLNSNPCKNQGFVLDGFPNTYDQAKSIFSGRIHYLIMLLSLRLKQRSCLSPVDDDALDQDRMFKQPVCNKAIAPGPTYCTLDIRFSRFYYSFSLVESSFCPKRKKKPRKITLSL